MADYSDEKLREILMHQAAAFISRESNRTSLITVTDIIVGRGAKQATILISVLPNTQEQAALDFLKRKRPDMREFLEKNIRIRQVPFLDVELDQGAKNAQNVDALLQSLR